MVIRTSVNEKGYMLWPKAIRDKLGIRPGCTNISLTETPDGILVKVIDEAFIKSLRGKYRVEGVTMQDFLDLKQEDRDLEEAKYQRATSGSRK